MDSIDTDHLSMPGRVSVGVVLLSGEVPA